MKLKVLFLTLLAINLAANLPRSQAAERIKFGTSVKAVVRYVLPLLAAEEKNFWKKQGLEAEWVPFDAAAPFYQAVAAELINIGMSGPSSAIGAAARGLPVIIIADMKSPDDFMVWVRSASPIREGRQLKGARIGISRIAGATHVLGAIMARALGLEKDVRFVGTGGNMPSIAALRTGAVDAIVLTYSSMIPLKLKGEAREILNVTDYLPKPWMETAVMARREFTEKYPEETRRIIKALLDSADFVLKNRSWAVQKMGSFLGYPPEAASAYAAVLTYGQDGKIDPAAVENIRNFMIENKLVAKEKVPPTSALFSLRFTE